MPGDGATELDVVSMALDFAKPIELGLYDYLT